MSLDLGDWEKAFLYIDKRISLNKNDFYPYRERLTTTIIIITTTTTKSIIL